MTGYTVDKRVDRYHGTGTILKYPVLSTMHTLLNSIPYHNVRTQVLQHAHARGAIASFLFKATTSSARVSSPPRGDASLGELAKLRVLGSERRELRANGVVHCVHWQLSWPTLNVAHP